MLKLLISKNNEKKKVNYFYVKESIYRLTKFLNKIIKKNKKKNV